MLNLSSLIVPNWFAEAKRTGVSREEICRKLSAYSHEIMDSKRLYEIENVEVPDEVLAEAMYDLYSTYYEKNKV